VQPTSAPDQPTTAPAVSDGANLVVVNWEMRMLAGDRPVNDIAVNQQAIAFVRVRNSGNQPASGFFAVLTIVNSSDSGAKIVEAGSSVGLAPGEEQVIQVGFNDNAAAAGTGRVAVVRLDENNQVPETNENDNASSPISYTLAG
jgi:subtilase family serine protease